MSKQKNSAVSQIVSTVFPRTGISHQFYLPVLFRIRPALARYFTVGGNRVINGLLILPFLILLITACGKPNKNSEFNFISSVPGSGGENTPFVDATFDGIEFIAIRHGCFMMGSDDGPADERPAHEVCITRDFYLSKTEVTQKQWKDAGMTPNKNRGPTYIYDDDKPAVNFAIFSVIHTISTFAEFAKKLGKKTGGHYRLPTEAEWEYAARAGTTTKYFFGDSTGKNDEVLKKYARFVGNSDGKLHKVATRKPNPWGLYDMYGNAYELTQDYYDANYYEESIKNDPVNRTATDDDGVGRVVRGGSYETGNCKETVCTGKDLRSAARFIFETSHYYFYGFRLLRER